MVEVGGKGMEQWERKGEGEGGKERMKCKDTDQRPLI